MTNEINQIFASTTHCPGCGRCFCSVTKTQAIDGRAVCILCKPQYEQKLRENNQIPQSNVQQ